MRNMRFLLFLTLALLYSQSSWSQTDDGTSNSVEAYAMLSPDGQTLTFICDGKREEQEGNTYSLNNPTSSPEWNNDKASITKVVFTPSFSEARPTSTRSWFEGMTMLSNIEGMKNLNTSEVITMSYMFCNCQSLKSIDLEFLDTHNTLQMNNMFQYCTALESIDLSHFDTTNNSSFFRMFQGCANLHYLDFTSVTFNSISDSRYLLYDCTGLDTLTLSPSMENISNTACTGVGSKESPCMMVIPKDFNIGTDTSGDYFKWKSGFFYTSVTNTTIFAESTTMEPGATALLSVLLNNDTTKIYNGYQMDIHLAEGLSIASDDNGYCIQPSERYSNKDMTLAATKLENNIYRLIGYSLSNATITGTEGPIFTIKIQADSIMDEGTLSCSINNITLSTTNGASIHLEEMEFNISITEPFAMGDVNHDREVDVNDVMLAVNFILGYPTPVFFFENADIDGSNIIGIADVMGIVGIILNG